VAEGEPKYDALEDKLFERKRRRSPSRKQWSTPMTTHEQAGAKEEVELKMSMEVGARRGVARHQGVASGEEELPVESALPAFDGANGWLNSQPLTPSGLRGNVLLVQFWTYTCINWLRTLPYIRAWAEKYRDAGLVVIGVHTPEFGFEKQVDNVRRAAHEMGIHYPVAVDNDYLIWGAFANHYWPALYFADAQGRIRHHRFGEGDYERSEMVIRQLLAESGFAVPPDGLANVDASGSEAAADWADLKSPENYVGYDRTSAFKGSEGVVPKRRHVYGAPARLPLNHWALAGDWTVAAETITLNEPGGRIAYQFHARDLHLVMGPTAGGTNVRFRVLIDGQPASAANGVDVDSQGNGTVVVQRMYQLIRQSKPVVDRRFEIEFLDSGVDAFVFTFG
jgi:thiol-disulfide isomerase/thioredoxin